MPNYHRFRVEGGTYFFTVVTYHRRPFLVTPSAQKILHDAWETAQTRFPFETLAVCLLPDHLHCMWKLPEGDSNYSIRWRVIKNLFSARYLKKIGIEEQRNESRKKRHEAAIWQRRFWEHWIRDDHDFFNHMNYNHYNPVKHGYVSRPDDWEYSSYRKKVAQGACPV